MTEDQKEKTFQGIVVEVLPNQMYRVRLDDGRLVLASLAPEGKHSIVRLISGSRILLQLATYDPGRGQIRAKLM